MTDTTPAPKWDCADGTPDEDHEWERKSDWYGDSSIPNGTCTFHFKRCRVCGKEAEDDGDYDDYEEYYRAD